MCREGSGIDSRQSMAEQATSGWRVGAERSNVATTRVVVRDQPAPPARPTLPRKPIWLVGAAGHAGNAGGRSETVAQLA